MPLQMFMLNMLSPACREAKIALAELGNDAGIYGAAALIV